MEFVYRSAKQVIALFVLVCYTVVIGALGWFSAIRYEAPAIRFDRSVRKLIEFDRHFPAPEPGWEACNSTPIPGEKDFYIKLCRETPPLR